MFNLILLFAAGYLILRLWNALGTRTGFENAKEGTPVDADIILEPGQFRSLDGLANDPDLQGYVTALQKKQKDFTVDGFLNSAKKVFTTIVHAYRDSDFETLSELLSPSLLETFQKNPCTDTQNLGAVEAEIQGINVQDDRACVTVLFRSQHNEAWRVDVWTFERLFANRDVKWILTKTACG